MVSLHDKDPALWTPEALASKFEVPLIRAKAALMLERNATNATEPDEARRKLAEVVSTKFLTNSKSRWISNRLTAAMNVEKNRRLLQEREKVQLKPVDNLVFEFRKESIGERA